MGNRKRVQIIILLSNFHRQNMKYVLFYCRRTHQNLLSARPNSFWIAQSPKNRSFKLVHSLYTCECGCACVKTVTAAGMDLNKRLLRVCLAFLHELTTKVNGFGRFHLKKGFFQPVDVAYSRFKREEKCDPSSSSI